MDQDPAWSAHFSQHDARWIEQNVMYDGYMRLTKGHLTFKTFCGEDVVAEREVLHRSAVAAVLPYDPQLDRVVLLEQVRPGCVGSARSPWLLEVVAGVLDAAEPVAVAAKRELLEETGLQAQFWLPMHEYWTSPGGSDEHVTLSCALIDSTQLTPWQGNRQEQEDIKCHVVTREQAYGYVQDGSICNGVSLIALQWLALHHQRLIKQYRGD